MEISDCICFLGKHFPYATDKIGLSERISSSAWAPCTCPPKFKVLNRWWLTSDRADYITFYRDPRKLHTTAPLLCHVLRYVPTTLSKCRTPLDKMSTSWHNSVSDLRFIEPMPAHATCRKEPWHFCCGQSQEEKLHTTQVLLTGRTTGLRICRLTSPGLTGNFVWRVLKAWISQVFE